MVNGWLTRSKCTLTTVLSADRHLYVLGTFPGGEGALFLGVPVTAELLAFHANVHTALANQLVEHWPHYLPGNWVPHCTLAEGLGTTQASAAFGLIYEYEPITVAVESVGIKDTASGAISVLVP
jgi:2'-5' RNA ligase